MLKFHYLLSAAIREYLEDGYELRQIEPETFQVYLTRDHANHITVDYVWIDAQGNLLSRGADAGY